MVNKLTTNAITGYPDKCIPANMKKGFELLICEGDSAAGGAKIAERSEFTMHISYKRKDTERIYDYYE